MKAVCYTTYEPKHETIDAYELGCHTYYLMTLTATLREEELYIIQTLFYIFNLIFIATNLNTFFLDLSKNVDIILYAYVPMYYVLTL